MLLEHIADFPSPHENSKEIYPEAISVIFFHSCVNSKQVTFSTMSNGKNNSQGAENGIHTVGQLRHKLTHLSRFSHQFIFNFIYPIFNKHVELMDYFLLKRNRSLCRPAHKKIIRALMKMATAQ